MILDGTANALSGVASSQLDGVVDFAFSMKLAVQEVVLKKLPSFDPSKGASFLTYMYEFIEDALLSFRLRQDNRTIGSLEIYKGIRRMCSNA